MSRRMLFLLGLAALLVPPAAFSFPWSATTENSVVNTISQWPNWDPANPVTISGKVWDNGGTHCVKVAPLANADSLVVTFVSPSSANEPPTWVANPYMECSGHARFVFTPGTDASGYFSFTLKGGGVSWLHIDDFETHTGTWLLLRFWKNGTHYDVAAGNSAVYHLPGCDEAPPVYGVLASCDLTSDGHVDGSDIGAFSTYLSHYTTLEFGWQADYIRTGAVDGSDLGYFAGRLVKDCNTMEASVEYAMDVRNLDDPRIQELMTRVGMTKADVIALWEKWGLSYDHNAAVTVELMSRGV